MNHDDYQLRRATAATTTDFFEVTPFCQRKDCVERSCHVAVETSWETRESSIRCLCARHAIELLEMLAEQFPVHYPQDGTS